MKKKYKKKIAIIFSSSILLKKKNGKNIDKYEYIVRFNRAPTLNFEEYVGSKTDLRVVNEHVFKNEKMKDPSWIHIDYNFINQLNNSNIMVMSNHKIKYSEKYEINNNNYHYFLRNNFFYFKVFFKFFFKIKITFLILNIILKKKIFSVGLTYLLHSIIKNKYNISLYGFDQHENMNYRSHYFEVAGKVGIYHNLNLEHQLIKLLSDFNYIKVYD